MLIAAHLRSINSLTDFFVFWEYEIIDKINNYSTNANQLEFDGLCDNNQLELASMTRSSVGYGILSLHQLKSPSVLGKMAYVIEHIYCIVMS